jgi:hypothetical protein
VRSFVVFHHAFIPSLADELPYTILKVVLDDCPDAVLHGRLRDAGGSTIGVGTPVVISWEEIRDGWVLPNWTPA